MPWLRQRLGVGEKPVNGNGDRVAEGGGGWEPASTGAWCAGHSTKRKCPHYCDQGQEAVRVDEVRTDLGTVRTQKA
jgi:hypothetical protein